MHGGAVAPSEKGGLNSIRSHRVWRYGPLVLWAMLIFIGSTSVLSASNTSALLRLFLRVFPNASEATLTTFHFAIRKAGHLTEYAILAMLTARAFRSSSHTLLRNRWFWASLLLVVLYALGDEFHQSFVPSRTASIYDSMIDTVGGLTALLLIRVSTASGSDRIKVDSEQHHDSFAGRSRR